MSPRHAALLVRPQEGRLIGGVCAAVAGRLRVDVTLTRLTFMLLALAWGVGLIIYGAMWAILPDADDAPKRRRTFRRTARGMRIDLRRSSEWFAASWRRAGRDPWPRPLGRRWIAVGLVAAGLAMVLASLGAFQWLNGSRAFGLALIAVGLSLVIGMRAGR